MKAIANRSELRDLKLTFAEWQELHAVATGVIRKAKGNSVPDKFNNRAAISIRQKGVDAVDLVTRATIYEVRGMDAVKQSIAGLRNFAAATAFSQPEIIRVILTEADLKGNNAGAILARLMQQAHDAAAINKNAITEIIVPEKFRNHLHVDDHNSRDLVNFKILNNKATIYNAALEGKIDSILKNQAPTVTVASSRIANERVVLFNKLANGQPLSLKAVELLAQRHSAALLVA